ncbi:putative signal transducing protein [Athalassotoga sp.]|uniref:putative signal transducing protein n=1 Tax=Athalassotoga sp. TaxID=2022597 RepID=UPI003CFDB88B
MKKTEWTVLDIFENGTSAEITRGFLEENGIEAKIRDSTVPYGGSMIFGESGPKELLVKAEELEEAESLLDEIKKHKE